MMKYRSACLGFYFGLEHGYSWSLSPFGPEHIKQNGGRIIMRAGLERYVPRFNEVPDKPSISFLVLDELAKLEGRWGDGLVLARRKIPHETSDWDKNKQMMREVDKEIEKLPLTSTGKRLAQCLLYEFPTDYVLLYGEGRGKCIISIEMLEKGIADFFFAARSEEHLDSTSAMFLESIGFFTLIGDDDVEARDIFDGYVIHCEGYAEIRDRHDFEPRL